MIPKIQKITEIKNNKKEKYPNLEIKKNKKMDGFKKILKEKLYK